MSYNLSSPLNFVGGSLINFQAAPSNNRIARFGTVNDGDMPQLNSSGVIVPLPAGANGSLFTTVSGIPAWRNPQSGSYTPETDIRLAYNSGQFINAGVPVLLQAYKTSASAQTYPVAPGVTNVYDTVITDTASAYNSTTGVFTAPSSGLYLCCAGAQCVGGGATSNFQVVTLLNGVTQTQCIGTGSFTGYVYDCFNVAAGETLAIRAQAITASSGSTGYGPAGTQFLFIYKIF